MGKSLRRKYQRSTSRQIVVLLLACAILPMTALTGLFYVFDMSVHRKEIVQVQNEVADRVAQAVLLHVQNSLNHPLDCWPSPLI